MSVVYFPQLHEDELIYSVLARYYQQSGYPSYIYAAADIYENKLIMPSIEFVNKMKQEILDKLLKNISMEELIEKHTMALAYMRFVSLEKRKRAMELLVKMDKGYFDLMKVAIREERNLCYCPECLKADREKYGEGYWHRIHQLPGIRICPIHKCYLKSSEIRICSMKSPSLVALEELELNTDSRICENGRECQLAEYIMNVFQTPIDLCRNITPGEFLQSKLYHTKYLSKNGRIRKMDILLDDLKAYYVDVDYGFQEKWQLQKMFDNHRLNLFEICQVAMFLGVSEKELVNMKLPLKTQEEEFNEKVMQLRESGMGYNKIGEKLGVSSMSVRMVGKYVKRTNCTGGGRKGNMQKLDDELLPIVEDACHKIYGEGDNRPKMVNMGSVSRYIGKSSSTIRNLPKCKAVILKFYETQEEYWTREIIWAAEQLQREGKAVHMTNIGKLTNMRKRDIERCQTLLAKNAPWIYTACFGEEYPLKEINS